VLHIWPPLLQSESQVAPAIIEPLLDPWWHAGNQHTDNPVPSRLSASAATQLAHTPYHARRRPGPDPSPLLESELEAAAANPEPKPDPAVGKRREVNMALAMGG